MPGKIGLANLNSVIQSEIIKGRDTHRGVTEDLRLALHGVLSGHRVCFSRKEVFQWNMSVVAVEVVLPNGYRRVAGRQPHSLSEPLLRESE